MASINIIAEYIWKGPDLKHMRSKCRTITIYNRISLDQIPRWHFDGTNTNQYEVTNAKVYLNPIKICDNPFLEKPHILVLCECVDIDNNPISYNTRRKLYNKFSSIKHKEKEFWFGFEQEFILIDKKECYTMNIWDETFEDYSKILQPRYCGIGSNLITSTERDIINKHYLFCLYAGLNLYSINAESNKGMWGFCIGTCIGIDAADQLWLARYILQRICEQYNTQVIFNQKSNEYLNGFGLYTNLSNKKLRCKKYGELEMNKIINRLSESHEEFIKTNGTGSKNLKKPLRDLNRFTFGVGNKKYSIRIPTETFNKKYGYIEDRRSVANADPYQILLFY